MKTKALKFVRKNLYQYDGIWMVKTGIYIPVFALMLCQSLNNRKFYRKQLNDAKNDLKNLIKNI
jgi:hypothetical protein